ncbi:MAG TPA: aminodeoxychorismate/anthranilate synthase component II [Candidatus Kapabacteria bacterium]|nr:aminodeoxychorismate/anthranilate synthase component II [Candidatus Kapabacteria bacterium]
MTQVLLIDNHDSFTHNLVQMVRESPRAKCTVVPHNKIEPEEVAAFDKIMFSPGPGLPEEFPAMFRILENYASSKSILGVCLGHQAIAQHFGGALSNLPKPLHGQRSKLSITRELGLLQGLGKETHVGLYHSWVVESAPSAFEVTSYNESNLIMSMMHPDLDIQGVQFHPESYMTTHGQQMIENWLQS